MSGLQSLGFEFLDKTLSHIIWVDDGFLLFDKFNGNVEKFLFNGLLYTCLLQSKRLLAFRVHHLIVQWTQELFRAFDHLDIILCVDFLKRISLPYCQNNENISDVKLLQ